MFRVFSSNQHIKRKWKDTLLNDNIGNIESEQHNADKIRETAQNIFKHTKKKEIRSFFINSKNTTVLISDFGKENTALIYRTTL